MAFYNMAKRFPTEEAATRMIVRNGSDMTTTIADFRDNCDIVCNM